MATESILEGASRAIEFITAGVSLLRVREAIGEYSYRDMVDAKLPRLVRLVVELNLRNEPMQLVLENLQFDFKAPQASCMRIGFELMRVYTRLKNAQHAKPLSAATI